jgi:hypothetical protein
VVASASQMPPMMAEPPDYERTIKLDARPVIPVPDGADIAADPLIERAYDAPTAVEAPSVVEAAPAPVADASTATVGDSLPSMAVEHHDAALVEQMQAAVADMPVEPHVEEAVPEPVIAHAAPAPSAPTPATGQDLELANALAAAVGAEAPSAMAAAAAPSLSRTTSVDHNVIAAAVQRAMTKMMPAIMTEVAKELDPEKK